MKIKRYVPELVYNEIQNLDYKNKEHLYIICDMLYRISIFRKEDRDYSNNFIDIPKSYFRDLICDSKSISNSFDILKKSNIIICDNKYSKESGKALGYKFRDGLISKLVVVYVEKKTLTKRIINNKNERNNSVNKSLHKYRDYYLSTFKIDSVNSFKYLNEWFNNSIPYYPTYVGGIYYNEWVKLVNKYNSIFISLSAIEDGDLFFRKNQTNGRVDTNLTNLKSEYKKFIINDKELFQIDIVNSQPFILYLYFISYLCGRNLNEADRLELEKYGDWTSSGMFYEMFERTYYNKTGKLLRRAQIKNMMFCIFYSKNGSYKKEKSIFKLIFPFIMSCIEEQKKNNHNEFAIKLQRMESKICIDKICSALDESGIDYYTIHDSWLVDKVDIDQTIKVINNEFYKNLYRRPELKVESINPISLYPTYVGGI
jgi:hypothetical protein